MVRRKPVLLVCIILALLLLGIPFENKSYEKQLKNLKNPDDTVRLSAIAELTNLGDKISPILLTSIDKEEDILFKVSIIQILGNIKDVTTVSTLIKYLNHDNWRVRFFSAESLGKLKASQAITPLKDRIIFDKNTNVRLRALLSLSEIEEFNDREFLKSLLLKVEYRFEDFFIREVKKIIRKIEAKKVDE